MKIVLYLLLYHALLHCLEHLLVNNYNFVDLFEFFAQHVFNRNCAARKNRWRWVLTSSEMLGYQVSNCLFLDFFMDRNDIVYGQLLIQPLCKLRGRE